MSVVNGQMATEAHMGLRVTKTMRHILMVFLEPYLAMGKRSNLTIIQRFSNCIYSSNRVANTSK